MRIIRIVLLAGALIGATSPDALAQFRKLPRQTIVPPRQRPRRLPAATREAPVPPNAVLWMNLGTIGQGTSIDVDLDTGERMRGALEAYDADGLTLKIDARRETYARASVRQVSYQKIDVARPVVVGAMTGALTGLATGWVRDKWNYRTQPQKGQYTLGGAVVGSVAGLVRGTGYPELVIVYVQKQ